VIQAVWEREGSDVNEMERILGRKLDGMERQRVGVSQLRRFLEKLLRRRYLENVPSIVPVLEKEFRNAQDKLTQTVQELSDLDTDKLKERGTLHNFLHTRPTPSRVPFPASLAQADRCRSRCREECLTKKGRYGQRGSAHGR
jgi:hypothetical protein